MKRRIVIIEPHADGHRFGYVQWMGVELMERGHPLTVLSSAESWASEQGRNALTAFGGEVEAVNMPDPAASYKRDDGNIVGLWRRHCHYRSCFARAVESSCNPDDYIVVPYLDYCDKAVALLGSPFGPRPFAGLAMRLSFHYADVGVIAPAKRRAFIEKYAFRKLLQLQELKVLFSIDEPLQEYTRKALPSLAQKVTTLMDPIAESAPPDPSHLTGLGLSEGDQYICLFGAITARKGLGCLLGLLARNVLPAEWKVVVAGEFDPESTRLLAEFQQGHPALADRVVAVTRRISGEEAAALLSAARAIWVRYEGHFGSSGVLAQAAGAGRPVIACPEGLIGMYSKKYSLGPVVDDPDDLTQETFLTGIEGRFDPVKARQFAELSSVFTARKTFADALEASL